MRKYNNFDLHFIFERKNEEICFLHAEYVHPLKQELVQEFQQDFQRDRNVKAAIVFGSGVEFHCNSYSDLDLCIERYATDKPFHYEAAGNGEPVDLLYADRIGERLRNEIEEKGIVVYDREGIYV
ncbi:MAG: nucleotidyltransferase domain-containing protein [Lachnospiraceae bacterium]|nr:nucleotidyltransferase domain-containing protein [Lachnospiraceae bacterium]